MSPKYKSFRIEFKPARLIFSNFSPRFAGLASLGPLAAPSEFCASVERMDLQAKTTSYENRDSFHQITDIIGLS